MAPAKTHPLKDFKIDRTLIDIESQGKDHLELDELKDILNNSLKDSIPWNARPYEAVQVLLFGWAQNDMNADSDIQILKYFLESTMGYDCDDVLIQGTAVKVEMADLLVRCVNLVVQSTPKTLSIFVYVGHGWSNSYDANDASNAKNLILLSVQSYSHAFATNLLILFSPSASEMESQAGNLDLYRDQWGVDYSTIAGIAVGCRGPVLHILKCCSAGGAGINNPQEVLAASCTINPGRRNKLYLPSGRFINSLKEHMTEMVQKHGFFTVAELHAQMASNSMKTQTRLPVQPWYRKGMERQSITLAPLTADPKSFPQKAEPRKENPRKKEDQVLFVVHLEKGKAVAADLYRWLADSTTRPEWVSEVKMCGYYTTGSTDIHLTMPMSLYASLPETDAITFLGYTKSTNLLLSLGERLSQGIPESAVGSGQPPSEQHRPRGPQVPVVSQGQHMRSASYQGGFALSPATPARHRPTSSSGSLQENVPPPGSRQSRQTSSGGPTDIARRLEQTDLNPEESKVRAPLWLSSSLHWRLIVVIGRRGKGRIRVWVECL